MVSYFEKTPLDEEFYAAYLEKRLPDTILDMHVHMTLPEYCTAISEEAIRQDWALQCSGPMTADDYETYTTFFYPKQKVHVNAFSSLGTGIDLAGSNSYISRLVKSKRIDYAHMAVKPEWNAEYCEEQLLTGGFSGFKPYPDSVSGKKGADICIFDFIPHEQLAILDKYKKSLVLHISRAGRLADDKNVRELKEMREKYPDIGIIIAHCGRSYAIDTINEGCKKMGSSLKDFYFDTAAVINPAVLEVVFEKIPHDRIFYGTDLPVFLFHGRRRWTNRDYFNLSREDFPWNTHEEGAEAESKYTFFVYEQLKNMLDIIDKFGGKPLAEKIFYQNGYQFMNHNNWEGNQ